MYDVSSTPPSCLSRNANHADISLCMYLGKDLTNIVSSIIHFLLFLTEVCQLCSSSRVPKEKKMVCPHCSHTMTRVSASEVYRTPPESTMGASNEDMLVDGLVDTRISMYPGQETGTTFKTPRQSEHQSRATGSASREGEANEAGEGEQDTLISKTG